MALFQTDNLWLSQMSGGTASLYLDVKDRPLNVLTRNVLNELDHVLDYIAGDTSIQALILRSGKPGSFVAGAAVEEFAEIHTAEQAMELSRRGQQIFNKLANLNAPSVAIISGPCLGGGLELALACDYRIVVDQPKTQLGLPEVELGLLPAWGGTQRLPRIIGLQKGLQLVLTGRRCRAKQAVQLGLADNILQDETAELTGFLMSMQKRSRAKLTFPTLRSRLVDGTKLGRWLIYRATERILRGRVPDDMPAPWEAFQAVKTGMENGFEAGLEAESEAAGRLATSSASRNLVHVFLRRQELRRLPDRVHVEEPPIRRVGVVGAGVMGAGIAQLAALHDCEVVVQEINESALGLGMLRLVGLFERAVERGVLAQTEYTKKLSAIHGSTTWKGFADMDLVIEAVSEDIDIKKALFREMEEHVAPSTILATNTSSLCLEALQEDLKHPDRIAAMHFFNPVHQIPLVEIARTNQTSDATVQQLLHFAVRLGKTPILVKDSAGFVVNRVLAPYLNEAVTLVAEGMRIELVDRAMKRFGMPVGPLELLDQIGLDVAVKTARNLESVLGGRFPLHPAFELFLRKGWLGNKTGVGFYRWKHGKTQVHLAAQSALQNANDQLMQSAPAVGPTQMMAEARDRMVMLMVNEAARCVEEEIVPEMDMVDMAMVLGVGWAPHRGGPLQYAKDCGWKKALATLEELHRRYGERFEPCPLLLQLASE